MTNCPDAKRRQILSEHKSASNLTSKRSWRLGKRTTSRRLRGSHSSTVCGPEGDTCDLQPSTAYICHKVNCYIHNYRCGLHFDAPFTLEITVAVYCSISTWCSRRRIWPSSWPRCCTSHWRWWVTVHCQYPSSAWWFLQENTPPHCPPLAVCLQDKSSKKKS